MDCAECNDFVASVEKHFAYLFTDFGFRVVHCEARKGGHYNSLYCLVGLESDAARIKFELEPGVPEILIGRLDAPLRWRVDLPLRKEIWYAVYGVLGFAEGQTSWDFFPRRDKAVPSPTVDEAMMLAAARLEPHAAELIRAFGPNPPKGWWKAYKAYRAELDRALARALAARGQGDRRSRWKILTDSVRDRLFGR